jgi:hypothetical protein
VILMNSFPFYIEEGGGTFGDGTFNIDLQTGVWSAMGLYGNRGAGVVRSEVKAESFFSPEVLAGDGIR